MTQRDLMTQILPNLKAKPARVIAVKTITKKNGGDKFYARLDGNLKHSFPENPFWGEVEIETDYIGLVLGSEYKSWVAGAAVNSGVTATKAEVKKEVNGRECWHTWENRFFEKDKRTGEKMYLKIQTSKSALDSTAPVKVVETYIYKGKRYSRKEAEEIFKGYLKPITQKNPTITQTEVGVDAAHTIHYYLPNVDDITFISQEGYVYRK